MSKKACLKLFNAVPKEEHSFTEDFEILSDYGVVVESSALHKLDEVKSFLEEERLSGNDLNKSFHKSWSKVANASELQLILEQLTHYLSTYGLKSIGAYDKDKIFIPLEDLDLPENNDSFPEYLPLIVIKGEPKEKLAQRCWDLLQSGVPLEKETIELIIEALRENDYAIKEKEISLIQNKEAKVIVAAKLGITPKDNGEEILRFLIFMATGDTTLLIKSRQVLEGIKLSNIDITRFLEETDLPELAKSYKRHETLWMSFKKANRSNRTLINKLNKLSKTHHTPLEGDVLANLTNTDYTAEVVELEASKAELRTLIKSYNAVKYYMVESENRFYSIRNGKGWAKKKARANSVKNLDEYASILRKEIKGRVKFSKVYQPPYSDLAFPISEKQFIGNVPSGTKVSIPNSSEFILLGIYWEGDGVDLDLRADGSFTSVGWNSRYRTKDRKLMHSGDITSAPDGATEWLYAEKIDENYLIKVNAFSAPDSQPFKVIIGYGSSIEENYVIDPQKVLFEAEGKMDQSEMTLGIATPTGSGIDFYFVGQGTGAGRVGGISEVSNIIRESLISSYMSRLKISDLFEHTDNPSEADLDLSLAGLDKDSMLDLL